MTSSPSLGPILAIAGLVIIAGAVIAGFLVVGGPGDARDRRLDEMTMRKVSRIADVAQCSYALKGTAPSDIEGIRAATSPDPAKDCFYIDRTPLDELAVIDYSTKDKNHIEICASFQRPSPSPEEKKRQPYPGWESFFAELNADRPNAGRHCFAIMLLEQKPEPGFRVVQ